MTRTERMLDKLGSITADMRDTEKSLDRSRRERIALFRKLRDAGVPVATIAERAGVSVPAVIQALRRAEK